MSTELPPGANPEVVLELMATFAANRLAVDAHWEQLVAEHDGEWVGAHDSEFVFGATIDQVLDQAKQRGWPLNVTFLRPVRRVRANILL